MGSEEESHQGPNSYLELLSMMTWGWGVETGSQPHLSSTMSTWTTGGVLYLDPMDPQEILR